VTERRHWLFWPLALAGWAMIAFAIRGLLLHHRDTNPWAVAKTVVALDLVHDLLLAPAALLAGIGLTRVFAGRAKVPVVVGLFVSAVTTLYAYPLLRGYGRSATTPSRLPNRYGWGLAAVLAVVWVVVGAATALRARRAR
jgi:hypothetical protein